MRPGLGRITSCFGWKMMLLPISKSKILQHHVNNLTSRINQESRISSLSTTRSCCEKRSTFVGSEEGGDGKVSRAYVGSIQSMRSARVRGSHTVRRGSG